MQYYGIWAVRSGASVMGPASDWCKRDGVPEVFMSKEAAERQTEQYNKDTGLAKVHYYAKEMEPELARSALKQKDAAAKTPVAMLGGSAPAKAVFRRKESDINVIKQSDQKDGDIFRIKSIVTLSPTMFDVFSKHLLYSWPFIEAHRDMAFNDNLRDCVMVRAKKHIDALLICPEGYDYARYTAYIPDQRQLDIYGANIREVIDMPAKTEVEYIKGYISNLSGELSVTDTQKLLCGIGEILENAGGEQDQYYLFSNRMGGFAGFCGDPIDVNDIHGNPLYAGDMTCLNGNPDQPQLVFRHPTGEPFPTADYVKESGMTRLAGWQESMMFLRSRDFDMISCRDDYRISKQIASRINTKNQEHGRTGR